MVFFGLKIKLNNKRKKISILRKVRKNKVGLDGKKFCFYNLIICVFIIGGDGINEF